MMARDPNRRRLIPCCSVYQGLSEVVDGNTVIFGTLKHNTHLETEVRMNESNEEKYQASPAKRK